MRRGDYSLCAFCLWRILGAHTHTNQHTQREECREEVIYGAIDIFHALHSTAQHFPLSLISTKIFISYHLSPPYAESQPLAQSPRRHLLSLSTSLEIPFTDHRLFLSGISFLHFTAIHSNHSAPPSSVQRLLLLELIYALQGFSFLFFPPTERYLLCTRLIINLTGGHWALVTWLL